MKAVAGNIPALAFQEFLAPLFLDFNRKRTLGTAPADHLSFYRLEQQFWERRQVVVPRQQMVQWVERIAEWLRPIDDAMWKAMVATGYLQVDETPVRVLDPDVKGTCARGYLWFYAVPGGDVLLEFDRHRSLEPVQRRLTPFVGTIQTDAYAVYQALERHEDGIERIACLAHARRRFYTALRESLPQALWFITQIRALYRIEDDARDLSPAARYALRHEQKAPAIWEDLKGRALELRPQVLPKSTMGKALSYFIDEYEALIGYLRDGRFEIDNPDRKCDPPHGRGAQAVALHRPSRRLPTLKITEISLLLPANWTLVSGDAPTESTARPRSPRRRPSRGCPCP